MDTGPDQTPREAASFPLDSRQPMADLRKAVNDFMAAEGRMKARNQRLGRLVVPGGLNGLLKLLSQDEMTSTQLAKASARSPAAVSEQLERLEVKGLIRRRRDDRDGRVVWVSLTSEGREQIAAVVAEWDQVFHQAFAQTSDEELEAAAGVLQTLVDLFDGLGVDE